MALDENVSSSEMSHQLLKSSNLHEMSCHLMKMNHCIVIAKKSISSSIIHIVNSVFQ